MRAMTIREDGSHGTMIDLDDYIHLSTASRRDRKTVQEIERLIARLQGIRLDLDTLAQEVRRV